MFIIVASEYMIVGCVSIYIYIYMKRKKKEVKRIGITGNCERLLD
jgi:hypothetical protein